jgi:hypothetical protein
LVFCTKKNLATLFRAHILTRRDSQSFKKQMKASLESTAAADNVCQEGVDTFCSNQGCSKKTLISRRKSTQVL